MSVLKPTLKHRYPMGIKIKRNQPLHKDILKYMSDNKYIF